MTAKEYFEGIRAQAKRLQNVLRGITNQGDDWHRASGRSSGLIDTTQLKALAHINALEKLQTELEEIEMSMSEARQLTQGVGQALGGKYKRVLEVYYIEAETLETTAKVLEVSKPTALRYRETALEWIDYAGFAHAKEGTGKAT